MPEPRPKSIRRRLVTWFTLVLAGVLAAFTTLLYLNAKYATEREIDARLLAEANALAAALVPQPDGSFELDLTPQQVEHYEQVRDRDSHYRPHYYVLWRSDGERIDASHPELEIPRPTPPSVREWGPWREMSITGPNGSIVLVGHTMVQRREQTRALVRNAVLVGAGVMLLAVYGAWFLTSRALAPIDRITRAAASVSASNLSQRIDVSRMEAELGTLSRTINDAFDRLQQAFDRQTRFTADASHELRTPLSIVLSHAQVALKRAETAGEYREALTTIQRAATRMKGTVEGLLMLARADAGKLELVREPFDLAELVEESSTLLSSLASEKEVRVHLQTTPTTIHADRERLHDVVMNLLTNAILYNRPGGRVDVAVHSGDRQAILTVADTGVGIPEAHRPHLFERFYRVDPARSRGAGGSGLGLAITLWIVEAHGGSIRVASKEEEGSTFTVRLPKSASDAIAKA